MIVFMDTETTGLDERTGHLLEVAAVVTDDRLEEVASFSVAVKPVGIGVDQMNMDSIVREMHTKNGLLNDVRAQGSRRHEAALQLVEFFRRAFVGVPDVSTGMCLCGQGETWHAGLGGEGACVQNALDGGFRAVTAPALSRTPIAGSTIGFDRRWLRAHMPVVEELFSYRSIDVSSLTELSQRWAPAIYEGRPKADKAHRALADARESIAYLKYFRACGFVGGGAHE